MYYSAMRRLLVLACLALLPLPASAETGPASTSLLAPPLPASLHELSTDALVAWRKVGDRPTLVLLTNEPFLQPIPQKLREQARKLATEGTPEDIKRWGRYFRPDPLLLPSQATRIAIETGLVGKVIWVMPLSNGQTPNASKLTETLVDSGILTESERQAFQTASYGLKGTVGNVPIEITTLKYLPQVAEPAIVHLDLSFFQTLYRNEIKTPAYSLVSQTARTLLDRCWNLKQATISYSTAEEGMVHVGFRFMGPAFADALASSPASFAREDRKRHSRILTLAALMQGDKALSELEALLRETPDRAYLHYEHYRFLRGKGRGTEALAALARATELDPGYGFEYLTLAKSAAQKGRTDAALNMLEKAADFFPENPFIRLETLSLLEEAGATRHALDVVEKLLAEHWSDIYHRPVLEHLKDLEARLKERVRTERK